MRSIKWRVSLPTHKPHEPSPTKKPSEKCENAEAISSRVKIAPDETKPSKTMPPDSIFSKKQYTPDVGFVNPASYWQTKYENIVKAIRAWEKNYAEWPLVCHSAKCPSETRNVFHEDFARQIMCAQTSPTLQAPAVDREGIYQWVSELSNSVTRENALLQLSKKREVVPDLAPMLWHSFGTIAALLQEIINIYPVINPATLTAHQSNRVCNALALLQCVASHPETRSAFLQAHIPLFLYPFLHTVSKTRPFEYLRLTSLGVIGALVKTDEQEVITFLLTTEIIPLCLRIMESGSELSKTVATFILQKILLDDSGLNYICQTYDRFSHVAMILGKMVLSLVKDPSARLLKHVVRCYLRLSDNPRAREALRQCLPDQLRDSTFSSCLQEDKSTKHWLAQLLKNLEAGLPLAISPLHVTQAM